MSVHHTDAEPAPRLSPQTSTVNQVVGASDAAVRRELEAIGLQVGQARELLADAIARLGRSFHTLEGETASQKEMIAALIDALSDGGQPSANRVSIRAFAAETSAVLQQFTDLLATVSRQSVRTVYRIDDMTQELDAVFKLVADVNEIAEETFILAVNATIEAAHAGASGRSFSVIAGNVRELAKTTQRFNDQIGDQITKAKGTVNEVRHIIAEMASRDLNVALAGKERVQQMFEQLEGFERFLASTLDRATGAANKIANATAEAVTALQCEDIINQLLGSAVGRTGHIDRLLHALEKAIATRPSESVSTQSATELQAIANARRTADPDPVQQRSMAPGEVELF